MYLLLLLSTLKRQIVIILNIDWIHGNIKMLFNEYG